LALAALAASATAGAGPDVGVSINVGQPGFYGHIDIGDVPAPPRVIYSQPVIIAAPVEAPPPPVYLHVPPGHAKHWRKHCQEYNACGVPVYFVQDNWYNTVYVPEYARRHGHHGDDDDQGDEGHEHGHGKHHGHGHGHDDD
jgi:hypothetical protein